MENNYIGRCQLVEKYKIDFQNTDKFIFEYEP